MRIEIIMPQMGESIAEGTVVKWLKEPGEKVERDEDLFEISTDKVESVIPSTSAGFLAEIVVGPGQKVAVGTVVGFITDDPKEVGDTGAKPVQAASAPAAASPAKAPAKKAPAKAVRAPRELADASVDELRRVRSTPLVRRIARANGINLLYVPGTGIAGRITKGDILSYIRDNATETASAAPAAAAIVHAPDVTVGESDRVETMSVMRQNIAEHMVMSRRVSAHCQTVHECDVTWVENLRKKYKKKYADRGIKLSFTVFLAKAVTDALRRVPIMNSSLKGNDVVYRKDVNLGVAVALESGLIVPVVKRADENSLPGLAKTVSELASKARNKQLQPSDVKDGTFTISNNGVFGALFGIPIISQPQVGILGVGGIQKRVRVLDDESMAIRSVVHLCLTFDHRVVDGAVADAFVNHIKDGLMNFPEGVL